MIAPDCLLVAGNRARRENHAIAFRQRDVRMLVLGDACERGAWLALRAGQQRHDLVARQVAVGVGRAEFRNVVEIAAIAGDVGHPVHGASIPECAAIASSPASHLSQGKNTLRTLAKCGRMCGRCRSSTLRILLSWIQAKPAGV